MTPISRFGHLALILSLVTGCEERAASEDVVPPIPDDSYVEVMAELSRLRRRAPTARGQLERNRLADSVRTEVLERHGVTAAEIIAYSDVVGSDPGRMQLLAERIATLADSLDADSARADSIRAHLAAPAARFDPLEATAGTDTLDAGADPSLVIPIFVGPGLAIPGLAIPWLVSPPDSATPTDSTATRPRPRGGRRPVGRPPPTPAPDSTADESNRGATGDDTGAA